MPAGAGAHQSSRKAVAGRRAPTRAWPAGPEPCALQRLQRPAWHPPPPAACAQPCSAEQPCPGAAAPAPGPAPPPPACAPGLSGAALRAVVLQACMASAGVALGPGCGQLPATHWHHSGVIIRQQTARTRHASHQPWVGHFWTLAAANARHELCRCTAHACSMACRVAQRGHLTLIVQETDIHATPYA